ncbi:uncharacterized protein LOC132715353 [Ruditapes philippinarum]|uniref:uncharacterized protein LOC132715353 n=1 Tax=Ruditapes philippinarum TaxID=129788 RepID=UPI00295C06D1|nr:uncharacterized protein LOC132715353 [Ruditapes philippinarum]
MAVNFVPSAALAKAASEKDLNQISECIGSNWEMLAPFLIERNSTATVEQIKDDHRQRLKACRTGYQRPETQQQQALGERMDVGQSDINEGDFRTIQHSEPMQGVQESRNSMGQFANNRQPQPLQGVQEIPQRISGFQSSVDDGHMRMDGGQTSVDGRQIRMDVDGGQPPVSRGQLSVDGGSVSRDQSSVDGGQPPVSRGQSSLNRGQRSFKDACLYDGRLLDLNEDIIENLRRENKEKIGEGAFGNVYKSASKSEDFGIHVVVKKIHIPLRYSFIAHTIKREMITSRIFHPFILPLLAAVEPPLQPDGEREFWFVSPLCENGDLYKVLKHDRMQQIPKLTAPKRVKILLQVALAIKYIHTKVHGVRAAILHKDIASKNIVLDDVFNARLIDFGLAREEDDMSSIGGGRVYYLHPEHGKGKSANESWDYYSFGVIVREMITTFGPEGQGPTHLKNMEAEYITHNIYKKIWEHDHLENAHGKLNYIATKLLEQTDWKVQDFTFNVIEKLTEIYRANNCESCLLNISKERGQACHSCMINTKGK